VRIRSTRTPLGADPPAKLGGGVVEAVDAALGFVAGQRRVARRLGVALIEGVRDDVRNAAGDSAAKRAARA